MSLEQLNIQNDPSPQDVEFLADKVLESLYEQTNVRDGLPLAVFIRDSEGKIISGLYGWTWGGCCELLNIWVDKCYRSKGYGTLMFLSVEREAQARKCKRIMARTHTKFGAAFCKKLGFKEYFTIEDYPIGHSTINFIKEIL